MWERDLLLVDGDADEDLFEDRLIVDSYISDRWFTVEPLALSLLSFFGAQHSVPEAVQRHPGNSPALVTDVIRRLEAGGLLVPVRRAGDRSAAQWEQWAPSAAYFHFSSRNEASRAYYAPQQDEAIARYQEKARVDPPPSPFKTYRGAMRHGLPLADASGELASALLMRRTHREFSRRKIALKDLATLLGLTFGVQSWKDSDLGRVPLKTFPSGGARHPLEAYVLAVRVGDLDRGLYHYRAGHHDLELLKSGASPQHIRRDLPGQPPLDTAAALVLITAVFYRSQWKYESPRAYRSILLEAGHACQNFCLLATSLGLAPFQTMLLRDRPIEEDLNIDGVGEGFLYAVGVGHPNEHSGATS